MPLGHFPDLSSLIIRAERSPDRINGTINEDNLLERIETRIAHPVRGDMNYEAEALVEAPQNQARTLAVFNALRERLTMVVVMPNGATSACSDSISLEAELRRGVGGTELEAREAR